MRVFADAMNDKKKPTPKPATQASTSRSKGPRAEGFGTEAPVDVDATSSDRRMRSAIEGPSAQRDELVVGTSSTHTDQSDRRPEEPSDDGTADDLQPVHL